AAGTLRLEPARRDVLEWDRVLAVGTEDGHKRLPASRRKRRPKQYRGQIGDVFVECTGGRSFPQGEGCGLTGAAPAEQARQGRCARPLLPRPFHAHLPALFLTRAPGYTDLSALRGQREQAMKHVRIGNGCGFWGDSADAPILLAESGALDYLTLEYLA